MLLFAPEGWWLADFAGMSADVPSTLFIDALEDSDLLLVERSSHERMIERIPGFGGAFTAGLQKQAAARERRILASLSATAMERYLDCLETYATIAQRVPQHMLASDLGMTPETSSRVRNKLAKRKGSQPGAAG